MLRLCVVMLPISEFLGMKKVCGNRFPNSKNGDEPLQNLKVPETVLYLLFIFNSLIMHVVGLRGKTTFRLLLLKQFLSKN